MVRRLAAQLGAKLAAEPLEDGALGRA